MNKICIAGNIARLDEREVNGTKVVNAVVAVRRRFKNKAGNYDTDFIPMSFWGKSGEFIMKHFKVGNGITVDGSLQRIKDKDNHWQTRFVPGNVEFSNMSYNKGTLSGNVARVDTNNGNLIVTVAVRRNFKNKEGKYDTDFFSAFVFAEKQKELINNYFPVGSGIILEYELRQGKNYSLVLNIDDIRFGNRKKKAADTTHSAEVPEVEDAPIQTSDVNEGFVVIEDDGDLPF